MSEEDIYTITIHRRPIVGDRDAPQKAELVEQHSHAGYELDMSLWICLASLGDYFSPVQVLAETLMHFGETLSEHHDPTVNAAQNALFIAAHDAAQAWATFDKQVDERVERRWRNRRTTPGKEETL